jgi:hypothetical protein
MNPLFLGGSELGYLPQPIIEGTPLYLTVSGRGRQQIC